MLKAHHRKGTIWHMTTLDEYRRQCGWSINLMARQVGIDVNTLRNALAGKTISAQTAGKLADAISARLKIRLSATDIEDLNVNW
jgi:plasmid maintenance system antidote protein VapI